MASFFSKSRLLLACLCFIVQLTLTAALYYEGTRDTYTQYERWNTSVNGTLRFQFKSRQTNVLLAYADDKKQVDFMEIAMEDGRLLLQMRINNKGRTIIVGENLDDGDWHTVEVIRNNPRKFTFKVDGDERSGTMDGEIIELPTQTDFFFGGIPMQLRQSHLSHPEVQSRTHLKGHLRNIAYLVQARPNRWRRPEQLASNNVREDFSDLCSSNDPCLNSGLCVSEDRTSRCECDGTGFIGDICEEEYTPAPQSQSDEEKVAITATFDGSSYLSYILKAEKINSDQDDIVFDFRTQHPNGLLLYVGQEFDYIYAALVNGLLEVAVNLGSGEYWKSIQPRREMDYFTDNNWHKVRISRTRADIKVRVDGSLLASGSTLGNFGRLTVSEEFYVGGSQNPSTLRGSRVAENFRGNLRDVSYYGNQEIEILKKAHSGDPLIYIQGEVSFVEDTVEGIDPITFLTEESLLRLPRWNAESKGTLSFDFRSNEPNAVIMYSSGSEEISDFLAFELLDGYLYIILDLGSGPVREKAYTFPLNDGDWHHVVFQRDLTVGIIFVGSSASSSSSASHKFEVPGHSSKLNLEMDLIVGGIEESQSLPLELFSGTLRHGYVGCIRNMAMNGETLDLPEYVEEQSQDGNIVRFCREEEPLCTSDPCQHGGSCREGWNRFICDCRKTGYTGETCKDEVARLAFNGNQSMRITLKDITRSKVENIFMRFRTSHPDGMIIATTSDTIVDILLAELSHGEVRVTANFGTGGATTITAGTNLDDNQWHSFNLERHDRTLRLTVDNSDKAEAGADFESGTLDFRYIDIGSLMSRRHLVGTKAPPPNFQGHMEQLIYNNHHYFDLAREESPDFVDNSATFGEQMSRRPIHDPFTFHTQEVHVQLPQIKTYPSLSLFFQFKTTEANGLIFFTEGELDFMAIELVDGFIYYAFNLGGGAKMLRGNSRERLNDNRWHEVGISHDSRDRQVLKVDARSVRSRATEEANHFDFSENLFIGGKETFEFLPEKIRSSQGYQGCLSSLEINGRHEDLLEMAVSMELKEELTRGCEDKRELCIDNLCNFGGICIPGFDTYTCDCSMTSFTGQYCSNVSVGYQFGETGGLISLQLPKDQWLRSDRDSLSFGFVSEAEDAVISHVGSATSNDYIEMKLIAGHLFVTYNFGGNDHVIGEKTYGVNDGRYHIVQFTRRGANSTLQVDSFPKVELFPSFGRRKQARYFDDQSVVNIGGRSPIPSRRKRRVITHPFAGIISGLAYNDLRIMDMAASGDSRIHFEGDVSLVSSNTIWDFVTEPYPTIALTTANVTQKPEKPEILEPEPSPHVGGNKTMTGPTKMIMSTATTDGEIDFGTDAENIFVTQSGCGTIDDEDCQQGGASVTSKGDEAIFTPVDEQDSTTAPSITTPASTTIITSEPFNTTPSMHDATSIGELSGTLCDGVDDPGCVNGDSTQSIATDFNFTSIKSKTTPTPPAPTPKITKIMSSSPSPKIPIGSKPNRNQGEGLGFLGQTWLVIGLVASGALIFLLLVIILYKFRNRNEGSYHINESRNYSVTDATRTALLPTQQQPNTNGTVPTKPIKPKLPPEYATKEWYV